MDPDSMSSSIPMENLTDGDHALETAVILIMGPSGSGKSHFIQAALGDSSIKAGKEPGSATQKFTPYNTIIDGRPVILVDTVDFDKIDQTNTDVLWELSAWLANAYDNGVRLAGIIYMLCTTLSPFDSPPSKNTEIVRKLVGDGTLHSVYPVTSRNEGAGAFHFGFQEALKGSYQFIEQSGSPVTKGSIENVNFYGTTENSQTILKSILKGNHRVSLNIQHELVDRKLNLAETEAGKFLLEELIESQSQLKRKISYMREKTKEAMEAGNPSPLARHVMVDVGWEHSTTERLVEVEVQILQLQSRNYVRGSRAQNPRAGECHRPWDLFKPSYLWEFGQRQFRPRLRLGYRRLEWRCVCGELLYGDFREGSLGSIEKLNARLTEHSQRGSQQGKLTARPSSAKADSRLTSSSSLMGWIMPQKGTGSNDPNTRGNSAVAAGPSSPNTRIREALQLCIETGKYTIKLDNCTNLNQAQTDGELFEKIRKSYERTRNSKLPMWLRFNKPGKAIFIKFRLGHHLLVSPIAGTIETPSMPPEKDVQAGRYRYAPCPIDEPPMDSRTFFHYFYSPASMHPDMMWSPRLPWKLEGWMAQVGWGIHLEEEPSWPLFTTLMFSFLMVSGLVAGIFAWKTGDNSTGVAIGTWLTAVQTMGATVLFFWWR